MLVKGDVVPDPCPYCGTSRHEFNSLKELVTSAETRNEFVLLKHKNTSWHKGERRVAEWQKLSKSFSEKIVVYSHKWRDKFHYWGTRKETGDTHRAALINIEEL